jgi:hypothetical protein
MIAATANQAPHWMVVIPMLLPVLMAGIPAWILRDKTRGDGAQAVSAPQDKPF